jgi:ribosomal protein L27
MYASNQRRAAAVLHYGERTIRSAFSELVTAGLLVVIHRGIRQHPDTVVVLGKPVTYVSRSGDSQPALNRQETPG